MTLSGVQEDPEEYMLRLGGELMGDADSPRAAALALTLALVERGGPPTAAAVLALGPQIPVRLNPASGCSSRVTTTCGKLLEGSCSIT